jgi:hypothetical protein
MSWKIDPLALTRPEFPQFPAASLIGPHKFPALRPEIPIDQPLVR